LFPHCINTCKRQAILPLSFQTKRFFTENLDTCKKIPEYSFNAEQSTSEKIIISKKFFECVSNVPKKFIENSTVLKYKEIQGEKILEVYTKEQNNNLTKNAEIYRMGSTYNLVHCDEKYKKDMDEIFKEIKISDRIQHIMFLPFRISYIFAGFCMVVMFLSFIQSLWN
jgi:hypothetical protein